MKIITILLVFMSMTHVFAQKNNEPSPEEIKQAIALREKYPKSDLAVLTSKEHITFIYDIMIKKIVVQHLKSNRSMNINHTTKTQLYEIYDDQSEIKKFQILTKNKREFLINVYDDYYKSDDYFYHDLRVQYVNLDFPIQGYSYFFELDKTYKDLKYFTNYYLTDSYPVVEKEIIIEVPKWLQVNIKEFNFEGYSINKTVTTTDDVDIYTYTIKNADPMLNEPDSSGPTYLYPHLLFVFKSYESKGKKIKLFESTADLYGWYHSLVKELVEDPNPYKPIVQQLIKDAKTDEEKIMSIYYWVQDNIRYLAFEDGIAGFKPELSQNVFTKIWRL